MLEAIITIPLLLGQCTQDCLLVRGDANGDCVVDLSDISLIAQWLCCGGPAPHSLDAADSNDDGWNDVSDYIYLLNYLVMGGSPRPPAPYPDPGYDCTPDELENCCSPSPEEGIAVSYFAEFHSTIGPPLPAPIGPCAGNPNYPTWDSWLDPNVGNEYSNLDVLNAHRCDKCLSVNVHSTRFQLLPGGQPIATKKAIRLGLIRAFVDLEIQFEANMQIVCAQGTQLCSGKSKISVLFDPMLTVVKLERIDQPGVLVDAYLDIGQVPDLEFTYSASEGCQFVFDPAKKSMHYRFQGFVDLVFNDTAPECTIYKPVSFIFDGYEIEFDPIDGDIASVETVKHPVAGGPFTMAVHEFYLQWCPPE